MELSVIPQQCPICCNTIRVEIHHIKQYVMDTTILHTISNEEYRYICPKCGIIDIKN